MGQQVLNPLCYSLFTHPPQIWLPLSVYVCVCARVYFNDLPAKFLHEVNHTLLPNQSCTHQQVEPIHAVLMQ